MSTRRSRWRRAWITAVGWLLARVLRVLGATWRVRFEGRDPTSAGGLAASWHCNVFVGTVLFRDRRVAMCVSRSRDGDLISAVLRNLGFADPARGSSSRGGSVAVRQLARKLQRGVTVGVLTDGPRGPARRSKIGIARLARLTGVPITPVALSARPRLRLRSWDRALVPMPFARVVCRFGEPVAVSGDADPVCEERICRGLDRELARGTGAADASLGLRGSGASRRMAEDPG